MADGSLPQFKTCTKCGDPFPLACFDKSRLGKFGVGSNCKKCRAAYSSARHKLERDTDPAKVKARQKAWREANPERLKELKRADYLTRIDAVKARSREWGEQNRDRRTANQKAWRDRNRLKVRESQRKAREKLLATPKGRIEIAVKANVRNSLKGVGKGKRTFDLLGYTADQLMAHLEVKFLPGMTWANYGLGGWHIDHIVPLSAHNYERPTDRDFQRAWALSNLRPLWEPDNLAKGSKLIAPFQPSLLL